MLLIGVVFVAAFTGRTSSTHHRHTRLAKAGHRPWDSADVMMEMMRLQAAYSSVDHLSFDITFNLSVAVAGITYPSTQTGHYKVNGNKYYIKFDSTEQMQDSLYHIVVANDQQLVTLQRPNYFFVTIMQMDVMDTLFQQTSVQGMTAIDSGSMRKISFQFYHESMIKSMNIVYDTGTYRLRTIYGTMTTQSTLAADSASGVATSITENMQFLNYQNGAFGDTVFNMRKYFTKQQDSFVFVHPYETYTFVNSTLD